MNFFRSALFHIKTRVCLKYFVHDCSLPCFFNAVFPKYVSIFPFLGPIPFHKVDVLFWCGLSLFKGSMFMLATLLVKFAEK